MLPPPPIVVHVPPWNDPYQRAVIAAQRECEIESFLGRHALWKNLYASLEGGGFFNCRRIDVLHLHWQSPYLVGKTRLGTVFRSLCTFFQLLVLRCAGVRVVWTIHNLHNHERLHARLERFFLRVLAKFADYVIVHCEASRSLILREIGPSIASKVRMIEHGLFEPQDRRISDDEARRRLSLEPDHFVFLALGLLRRYKGFDTLTEVFRELPHPALRLLVVGASRDAELLGELQAAAHEDSRITIVDRFVNETELEQFHRAADVVVLPYRAIISSGSASTAMGFAKPIVFPRLGCATATLDEAANFLYSPGSKDELRATLLRAFATPRETLRYMGEENLRRGREVSWIDIAHKHLELYTSESLRTCR